MSSDDKILILTDDYGRNIAKLVRKIINSNTYQIETIIKPGAAFQQVIEDLEALTKNYTLSDYVIIIAGSNNFNSRNRYPLFKDIAQKVIKCSNTNLIISTAPYKSYNTNTFIRKYNKKLTEFLFVLGNYVLSKISLLEITDKGYKNKQKNQIACDIVNLLLNKNKQQNFITVKRVTNNMTQSLEVEHLCCQEGSSQSDINVEIQHLCCEDNSSQLKETMNHFL